MAMRWVLMKKLDAGRVATTVFAIGVLALLPAYLSAVRLPSFGLFHDDGIYLVTAKALAEGQGYRITSLPSAPPQTKYPPVFPLLLAAVWGVFPDFPANLVALKLVPLLGTAVWVGLSLRLLRELGLSVALRCLTCFATLASPLVVYLSATLLSETTFAALCTGALLCLEVQSDAPSLRRTAVAGALAAMATLTRIVGVSLIVAGLAWLLLAKRRPRHAVLFGSVSVGLLIPWWIWVSTAGGGGYYAAANYGSWNVLAPGDTVSFLQRIEVVVTNLLWIPDASRLLLGAPPHLLLLLAALSLLGVGIWRLVPEQRVSLWFLLAYLMLITLWAWPPHRFVAVVLPLVVWAGLAAISACPRAVTAATVLLVLVGTHSVMETRQNMRQSERTGVLPFGVQSEEWQDIEEVGRWVRSYTAADDVIVGNLDPLYYLLTGRRAVRAFDADPFRLFYSNPGHANPLGDSEGLLRRIKSVGASVVIDSPDLLYAEGLWLKRLFQDLERRGDLHMVQKIGGFRILAPSSRPN